MNERIKALKEQAEEYTAQYGIDHKIYQLIDILDKKFAELIVQECMRMCDVASVGYDTHGHIKEANGCVSAKEYIAEHFGVEE